MDPEFSEASPGSAYLMGLVNYRYACDPSVLLENA